MARNYTKSLLISANVGSIFEDPEKMMKKWLSEFLSCVKEKNPDFLAIHCQEVGGKNYEESMQHVNSFIKVLLASPEMQQFDKARVFLDEDFTAVDKFTALGNCYFIHQSVQNVQLYDFKECKFVPVKGREVLSGNIEDVPIKEKAKFPQEFFPDFKWSRKGFIRCRWNIHNTVFDLINIHLFHDANNIVAMESSPSVYNGNRCRTLRHTLERFDNDQYPKVPYFLFGDFNFRLDTHKLVKKLGENAQLQETRSKKNDVSKVVFSNDADSEAVLVIEKKGFKHHRHNEVFSNNNGHWLHKYDTEADAFKDKLKEYDVTFPPSYPFSEDVNDGTSYMNTRCPAWCDRVMFTPDCLNLLFKEEQQKSPDVEYSMMGIDICMGDHKPIYLDIKLKHGAGSELDSESSTCTSVPSTLSLSSPPEHDDQVVFPDKTPLQKVISINGEEIEVGSPEALEDMNIHDFARFEKEEAITHFIGSLKRKSGGLKKRPSFKNTVKDVMRAESFLKALKHYSHRSDSETDDTDTDVGESPHTKRPSRKRRSAKDRNRSKSREGKSLPSPTEDEEGAKPTFFLETGVSSNADAKADSTGNGENEVSVDKSGTENEGAVTCGEGIDLPESNSVNVTTTIDQSSAPLSQSEHDENGPLSNDKTKNLESTTENVEPEAAASPQSPTDSPSQENNNEPEAQGKTKDVTEDAKANTNNNASPCNTAAVTLNEIHTDLDSVNMSKIKGNGHNVSQLSIAEGEINGDDEMRKMQMEEESETTKKEKLCACCIVM